jgi:glycosyltransferase involved in cell wall biosynthesis
MLVVKDYWRKPRVLIRALATFGVAAGYAETVEASETRHVHAHFASYPALAAWVCRRLTGIPYSFTAHAHDLYTTPMGVGRRANDAKFVVSISEFNRRLLRELAPEGAPIHVVHCGVDTDFYRSAPHTAPRTGAVRALCVASLREVKGHRVLLEALAEGAGRLDRIELDLVGDGPLRSELEDRVERLGLSARVRFHGDLTEHAVVEMLEAADIFVLPSVVERNGDTEGIPVALMEAMAAGVPVVASRLTGVPELVHDGETGLLAEPGDVSGLADRLAELLAEPHAAVARAALGRYLVEREFSLASSAAHLAMLFSGGQFVSEPAFVPIETESRVLAHA